MRRIEEEIAVFPTYNATKVHKYIADVPTIFLNEIFVEETWITKNFNLTVSK